MSELDQLLAVQVLDSAIDQLVFKRAHLEQRSTLAAARQTLGTVRTALSTNAARQAVLDARYAELEQKGKEIDTRSARLQDRLRTIVVTREAEAVQREIAGLRSEREAADEEGLVILDELETLSAQADALTSDSASAEAAEHDAAAALAAAEADVDAEIADVRARRAEIVATVPEALVARYESMRPTFKGVAVAKLQGAQCTGCHLNLSRVEVEAVWAAMSGGGIVECPQCGRILVRESGR